jgi:phospholipid/cholesterol/gamma-HCH transport system substrate-binding protein
MSRALGIVAVVVAVAAVVVLAVTAGSGTPSYRVRAIFDNAGFAIPGEDVRIAGVKVGKIDSLDVTPDNRAAVVLEITQPGYQDFRRDATCEVRPQSLIGERFVDCTPTEARAVGEPPPPPLRKIRSGPGKGEYLLPVQNTSTAVDLDLIGDIMREPERQRLSLILNELGTGLAGRGKDLNDVIRRADPALEETDKVLRILASQNEVLRQLAVNSDTVLAPLARQRAHVTGAIRNASAVARATAERRGALEADIRLLPPFLRQLRPTMQRLGALSDQMTPVLGDAHAVAPDINRVIEQLGPFSTAAIPAVDSLGQAAKTGIPAVQDALPVVGDLRKLAGAARPVASTGAQVLDSVKKTQGIERLMDYVFYQVAAINGFDSVSHYLRANLIVNQCAIYATAPVGGCSANFAGAATASAATASAPRDPALARTARVLAGALGRQVEHADAAARRPGRPARRPGYAKLLAPPVATPSPSPSPTVTPAPPPAAPAEGLLDYLFGKDGG